MRQSIWKFYWRLGKWKVRGKFPYDVRKLIMIVGPHTSSRDVVVGFAARAILKIDDAKFLGKKELFKPPFGRIFHWLGGVPVDRSSKQGMVEQVVKMFDTRDRFLLAMAPEGTRKRVDKLKTGFYHIARSANVPILPIGLDFKNKELVVGNLLFPGDDEVADFQTITDFFSMIEGANPAFDLRHLKRASTNT